MALETKNNNEPLDTTNTTLTGHEQPEHANADTEQAETADFNFETEFARLFGSVEAEAADVEVAAELAEPNEAPEFMDFADVAEEDEEAPAPVPTETADELPAQPKAKKSKRPSKAAKIISEAAFYLTVVMLLIAVFIYGTNEGTRNFFGLSYANVLTESMQSEMPKGSFVLIRETNAADIQVGDDITYIREDNTTVTHRVMTVYENYEDSGVRGFVTKGIDNAEADPDVIHPSNVLGVVIFHIPLVGQILSHIAANVWIIAALIGGCILLSLTLRIFFGEVKRERAAKRPRKAREN